MVITDWSKGRDWVLEELSAALAGQTGIAIQHRHPGVTTRQFLDEGRALAQLCSKFNAPLFINSRLDVARALDAHLHLATHAITVADAKPCLPVGTLVSHAVHALGEYQPGADFALVSPVFTPRSKPTDSRPLLGVEGFIELARQLPCPAFALGGLTPATAAPLRASAAGFALTLSAGMKRFDE